MATELENLVPEADVEVEGMRGPKGDKGDSYVLTEADKEEIARKVDTIVDAETDKTLKLSGKPADAKAAGDEINSLKADLTQLANITPSPNLLDLTLVTSGYYIEQGVSKQYAGWGYSDYIPVDPNTKYYFGALNSAYNAYNVPRCYVNFYDSEKEYINGTGTFSASTTLFESPTNARYAVLSASISNEFSASRKPMFCASAYTQVEGTLALDEYVPYGNEVTIKPSQISNKIDKDGVGQVTKSNADFLNPSTNLLNYGTLKFNTYISNSDGSEIAYNNWTATDFIPVGVGTYALVNRRDEQYDTVTDGCYGALYDINKNFISGFNYPSTSQNLFTISNPSVSFIRISNHSQFYTRTTMFGLQENVVGAIEYAPNGWLMDSDIKSIGSITNKKPWNGKKWCDFGDSIAYNKVWCEYANEILGADVIYNRGIGSSAVSHNGQSPAYVTMNGELIGRYQGDWDTYHALVNGLTEGVDYYEISTTMMCSQERVNTIPTDSDIISILAGMNDFETITAETLGDVDSMWDGVTASAKTFCGAYRRMLELIHARVPNANIILCVPTKYSAEYTDGTRTSSHLINEQMREKIREISKAYGCQVIDFATLFNPTRATTYNASTNPYGYLRDRTHPNDQGNNAMGLMFAKEGAINYFATV